MIKQIISMVLAMMMTWNALLPAADIVGAGFSCKWDFSSSGKNVAQEEKKEILLAAGDGFGGMTGGSGGSPLVSDQGQMILKNTLFPSLDFDPILAQGMVLVIHSVDEKTMQAIGDPVTIPIRHSEFVTIPGIGNMKIVGEKLSVARDGINKYSKQKFQVGVIMGNVSGVQVLGKVQKPGNYPADMPLTALIAESLDRATGSNFKIHVFDGVTRTSTMYRYEDIAKGNVNPIIHAGSIVYFPPSAGAIFGEMTEKQVNLFYVILLCVSALGISAIAKN